MPYVKKSDRPRLESGEPPETPGELNYVITRQIDQYLSRKGINYETLNAAIGVLECPKLELYRRIVAEYEEKKIASPENGDVYSVSPERAGTQSHSTRVFSVTSPKHLGH